MKHFNNQAAQTKILTTNGAFFAFSSEQWEQANDKASKYKSLGGGMYCPENNVGDLTKQLAENLAGKIRWELENNTLKDIIWYELANHEAQITGDLMDTIEALTPYKISLENIKHEYKAYLKNCISNDYF